jgi:hypothetical protein
MTSEGKRKGSVIGGGTMRGETPPPISVVVLSSQPTVKKTITKRYPAGRVLSLLVDDDKLLEKTMTFNVDWDYDLLEEEKEKGNSISFKYWQKAGLEISLTYFGFFLVGKMITLDFLTQPIPGLVLEDWRDELDHDIALPMVNFKKLVFEEGYCREEVENPFMKDLMHDMVVKALLKRDDEKLVTFHGKKGIVENGQCDYCLEVPCVWLDEREAVVENDRNENGHTFLIENKTRRKIAFRHMFRVVNGGPGQKGVRKQLPECVECGVRRLFPDEQAQYLGFKEE